MRAHIRNKSDEFRAFAIWKGFPMSAVQGMAGYGRKGQSPFLCSDLRGHHTGYRINTPSVKTQ